MRFSLFGIPIHVRPIFWVVVILLAMPASAEAKDLLAAASWVAIVFVSILVHELGHAFAMRSFGRAPSIELWGMGGLTSWGDGPEISRGKRLVVSLAGPGAGFLLAIPIAILAVTGTAAEGSFEKTAIDQALFVNVGWGILNLLPILPLDGGHVMESLLASVFGSNGPRYARYVSLVLAIGAGAIAIGYGWYWGAMIAFFSAMYAYRTIGAKHGDGTVPAESKVDPRFAAGLASVWSRIQAGETEAALREADVLHEETARAGSDLPHLVMRAQILEAMAWAHIEAGDDQAAAQAARRMPEGFAPPPLLAARLLYGTVDRVEGMRALERAFHDTPGELAGLVLGAAYVENHRADDAVAMLRTIRGAALSSETYRTISSALFYAERFEQARAASELAWNRFRKPDHAYGAARACARLGLLDDGIDWLERALAAGLGEREKLADDPDLEPLRASPRFAALHAPSGE